MKIPRELTRIQEGTIEVRMPMTPNETLYKEDPYYHIRKVSTRGSFSRLAYVATRKTAFGYLIVDYFDVPFAKNPSVLGFAFTTEGADQFAHKKAVSLAQKIADINGLYFKDLSAQDKKDLNRIVSKDARGGAQ